MCDPITAAVVLSVAAAGTGVVAQSQAANAQAKAVNAQSAVQAEEIKDAATADLFDAGRAARRERARLRVAATNSGLNIASQGVEGLILDSFQQQEFANDRIRTNAANRQAGRDAQTKSALASLSKPTALGAGLQIGAAGGSAFLSATAAAKAAKGGQA